MDADIVIVLIAGCVSLLVAAIAYYQAKRVMFFQMLFERKANAYEKCFVQLSSYAENDGELNEKCLALRTALLYCTNESRKAIEQMIDLLIGINVFVHQMAFPKEEDANKFIALREILVHLLRKELEDCRRFKFN